MVFYAFNIEVQATLFDTRPQNEIFTLRVLLGDIRDANRRIQCLIDAAANP